MARRTILWAAINSIAAGSAAIVMILPWLDAELLTLALVPTTLLAAVAVRQALTRHTVARAVFATIWICALAGFANGVLIFALVAPDRGGRWLSRLGPAYVAFGPLVAPAVGALFGACFAAPVAYAMRLRDHPTVDAADRVCMFHCTVSLVLAVGLAGLFFVHHHGGSAWLAALLHIGGAVGRRYFARRIAAREAWIDRVRKGEIDGWDIARLNEVSQHEVTTLLPAYLSPRPLSAALVQRTDPQGAAPYRCGRIVAPYALVDERSRLVGTVR